MRSDVGWIIFRNTWETTVTQQAYRTHTHTKLIKCHTGPSLTQGIWILKSWEQWPRRILRPGDWNGTASLKELLGATKSAYSNTVLNRLLPFARVCEMSNQKEKKKVAPLCVVCQCQRPTWRKRAVAFGETLEWPTVPFHYPFIRTGHRSCWRRSSSGRGKEGIICWATYKMTPAGLQTVECWAKGERELRPSLGPTDDCTHTATFTV